MKTEVIQQLIETAIKARESSYSPYSNFAVGAALLAENGKIYSGANIESASYTPTVCAERVAFFNAISNGERDFTGIAIVGGKASDAISAYCSPCGVCRQVMAEFCGPDFKIILFDGTSPKVYTLGELLPESFSKENIK